MTIEINPEFKRALDLMEHTTQNVFITGRAGTGKSTLLTHFRSITTKKVAYLAPTGVAALNINGQTIHSFFKFRHDVTLDSIKKKSKGKETKLYKKLDAIVIDEISMVRADLLDSIDKFMRLNGNNENLAFGGVQMIFIGDLYQLPPVVNSSDKEIFKTKYTSPYFFSAHFFDDFDMEFIELEKIYRQKDETFITLLNAIRNKTVTDEDMDLLKTCVHPEFSSNENHIYLTPKNIDAETINERQLEKLDGKPFTFEAEISGAFGKEYFPTRTTLKLKPGSQIMMVNNDPKGRWVNGTMGTVLRIKPRENETLIIVELEDGEEVVVRPHLWEISRFFLEGETIQTETIGAFTQYPLMLAWALTIHKSQGKTFHKVIVDIGSGTFSPGQVYVALSRCTSLEGLVLKKPIEKKHIWIDYEVVHFITKFQYQKAELKLSFEDKVGVIKNSIAKKQPLEIVYLKANDEKSKRIITPQNIGEMTYRNITFMGMEAYCHLRKELRTLRVDRILEIEELKA
jgi:ATP-dependent exoDNAse (exonuclease V) alpha subunit